MDKPRWKKARRSGSTSNCVEVARADDGLAVRDSKNPAGGVLTLPAEAAAVFIGAVKGGRFDG